MRRLLSRLALWLGLIEPGVTLMSRETGWYCTHVLQEQNDRDLPWLQYRH